MLTGQTKTDYQREYMRKRRSNTGSNSVSSKPFPPPLELDGSNKGLTGSSKDDLKAKLSKVGLNIGKDGVLDPTGLTRSPIETVTSSKPPVYNKRIHKAGDRVRMPGTNIVTVVPELDGEGNQVHEM